MAAGPVRPGRQAWPDAPQRPGPVPGPGPGPTTAMEHCRGQDNNDGALPWFRSPPRNWNADHEHHEHHTLHSRPAGRAPFGWRRRTIGADRRRRAERAEAEGPSEPGAEEGGTGRERERE